MHFLDIKTILFSYAVSNAISSIVIFMLWLQNRSRFAGLGFWLADFVMQFIALSLVMMRGILPDFVSMTVSNSLIIGGTILLYKGLERFVGKQSTQIYNLILLVAFIPSHAYFVFVQPSLSARTILLMAGLSILCFQCAWLMLRRVDAQMYPITFGVGIVFAGYCLVSVARIAVDLAIPSDNNLFNSNSLDALLVMTDQMLFIILTFNLFLMVNRRLVTELESDITERKRTEEALRLSEEKFYKAFHSSPDAVLLTRLADGQLVEINEGFSHITGYSREEALASSTINLELWVNPQDREKCIADLRENQRVRDLEYDFRAKSGKTLNCLYSGELIQLGNEVLVLSVVRDITERKQADDALQKQAIALAERVKELNCIGELARLIETPGISLAEILLGSVNLLKAAMQYTELASVRLVIGGQSYTTENYQDSACKLSDEIMDHGRTIGVLEVCYPQEMQQEKKFLFWEEEKNLLHIVANRLGHVVRRMQAEEALRESEVIFSSFLENSPIYVFFKDRNIRALRLSKNYEQMLGVPLSKAIGKTMDELFPSELAKSMVADDLRILNEGQPINIVEELNGRIYETTKFPIFKDGKPDMLAGFTLDITERVQAEELIQLRLRLFDFAATHTLAETMQNALDEIGLITRSPIGFYHFVEPDQKNISLHAWSTRTVKEFCRAEGRGSHYSIDQAGVWVDCVHQRKPVIHNDYAALSHRKGLPEGHAEVIRELVVPILRKGQVVSILGVGNKPFDYDDKDVEFVSYIADIVWEIVDRKRAEERLRKLSRAVEQSPASIVITDTQGKIEYVNPRFTQVTGYSPDEAIGQNPRILKTELTPPKRFSELWKKITSGKEWQGEFVNRKKNGELFYESAIISPITDPDGVITHYLAVKEDITGKKRIEEELRLANQKLQFQLKAIQKLQGELREQAIRDPLTGLYNRRYLSEILKRELARAAREVYPVSFVMIDIDHFKNINDTFGHHVGDLVLQKLANLLLSQSRVGDILCRYGGEEFLAVLPNVSAEIAHQIAERWRILFQEQKSLDGEKEPEATISCGIASWPSQGNTAEELIATADKAMYHAKSTGRNRVIIWEKNKRVQ